MQLRIATAAMSREIFLAFGNTGPFNPCRRCKTVRGNFLRDLSTLSHIRFLCFLSLRCLPPEEACHWILSRLRLPAARLSATHDDLRVATLLQIMFAAVTPVPLPPEEACHWILSRLRLPANPVPLPPLEMCVSCRGHARQAYIDRPAAKRKALLWAG